MGKPKDNKTGMEWMNNKKTRHIVIATHTKKNMSTTREHEEEDVQRKEENCNITPFVPLSPRLNQRSSRQNQVDEKNFLHRYGSPVQWKVSQ